MRWILRGVGLLLLVVAIGVGALFAIPSERIATVAADRISQATGRDVRFEGAVRPVIWPHLGVRAEDFSIGNPDWVDDGPLIAAQALSIRVPWSSVFVGEVLIDEITLIEPDITLVRRADGLTSWAFGGGAPTEVTPAPDAESTATRFALNRADIQGGALVFRDEGSGQAFEIADLTGSVQLPETGASSVDLAASVNGETLNLTAAIGGVSSLLDGAVSPIVAALSWTGGEAGFDGTMSITPAFDGDLTLSATDLGPLAALAGQRLPDLPLGYGRDQIGFRGHVTLADGGTAHIRDADVMLDSTAVNVALDVLPGEDRPLVRGAIRGDRLTLPEFGDTADASDVASGQGWPRDPIDVSGIFAVDAEIAIAVNRLDLGPGELGPVDLRATLTRGRLVFDIDSIGAYDGTLAGQFVVNGRGGLSVGGDLILAGVELSPLLSDWAGYERLTGSGSASLQFLGVGNDLASIMESLSGQGDIAFGAGAIEGLDIAGMIRNFDDSYRGEGARTVYDRVSANFAIEGGVLDNEDLILDAPWGDVTGAGQVDLGAQTLDYRLVPGLLRGQDGGTTLRIPILITGPWLGPSIRPDLEYLAEQELAEEAARLEAEARARLEAETDRLEAEARAQASELLGVELEEGATVEDGINAAEEALREEVGNQLQRLLGGN